MKNVFLAFVLFLMVLPACKDSKKAQGTSNATTSQKQGAQKFVSNNGILSFDYPSDWTRLSDEEIYAVFQNAKKPLGKFYITAAKVSGSRKFDINEYIGEEKAANLKLNPVSAATEQGLPLLYYSKVKPGEAGVKDHITKFFSGRGDFLIMAQYKMQESGVSSPEYKKDMAEIIQIFNKILLP